MNYKICKDCEHFMQHYIKSKINGIHTVDCGHCKLKQKNEKLCTQFQQAENLVYDEISILNLLLNCEKKLCHLKTEFHDLRLKINRFSGYNISLTNKNEP